MISNFATKVAVFFIIHKQFKRKMYLFYENHRNFNKIQCLKVKYTKKLDTKKE